MKKRPTSHVTDSVGIQLFRSALPQEWVVREYKPDYGIDFAVEVFDSHGDEFVTFGEHFFVQLKSRSRVQWVTREMQARGNVESSPLKYDRRQSCRMRVIAEAVDTAELQLARSMGSANPLVFVVADTTDSVVHWVCLNDFVDKVLVPKAGQDLSVQGSHTIYLPEFNRMDLSDEALFSLRFLARRGKLYSAFNRFRYQRHQVQFALERQAAGGVHAVEDPDLLGLVGHFLGTVLAYDFWETTDAWRPIGDVHLRAETTANMVAQANAGDSLESILARRSKALGVSIPSDPTEDLLRFLFVTDIETTFDQLANLGNMFEEVCREWSLPTYLGMLTSNAQFDDVGSAG